MGDALCWHFPPSFARRLDSAAGVPGCVTSSGAARYAWPPAADPWPGVISPNGVQGRFLVDLLNLFYFVKCNLIYFTSLKVVESSITQLFYVI